MKLDTRTPEQFIADQEKITEHTVRVETFETSTQALIASDQVNFFGLPWWNCPTTGKRCTCDCWCFTDSAVSGKDDQWSLQGFSCSNF